MSELVDEYIIHYLVKTNNDNYNLTIIKKFYPSIKKSNISKEEISLKANSYTILLGGEQKGCVEITFTNPNTIPKEIRERMNIDYGIATINHINSGKQCNIDGTLEKRDGTRKMVMTAMYIVYHTFDWIHKFKLHDFSYKDCIDGEKSTSFSVLRMSIALHGSTWYEKSFGAKLSGPNLEKYQNSLKKLEDPTVKLKWEEFELFIANKLNRNKEIVKNIYKDTKTYREFFNQLSNNLDKTDLCLTLQPWVSDLIDYTFGYQMEQLGDWSIDAKTIRSNDQYKPILQPYTDDEPNYIYDNYKIYLCKQRGGYNLNQLDYLKELYGGFRFF